MLIAFDFWMVSALVLYELAAKHSWRLRSKMACGSEYSIVFKALTLIRKPTDWVAAVLGVQAAIVIPKEDAGRSHVCYCFQVSV